MIIAPHEISANRIESICGKLRTFALRTETNVQEVKKADCLIINTMGILSAVYQHGQLAYIGGGFGAGIHNTLKLLHGKYLSFLDQIIINLKRLKA